jgi:4-hydroxy-4-methyl-2-oxoglutarate aldolase
MDDTADIDLERLAASTYAAVFSDICDRLGLREQTLDPTLRRLAGPRRTLVGWARTALSLPVTAIPARPYGLEIDFIDSLLPGDVVVLDCSRRPAAAWGELFSTAATGRGARGAIIDGHVRDIAKIDELGRFPVFGTGTRPTDSLGRVAIAEHDRPVCVAGATVRSGDLVVADDDGVTVVPRAHAREAIALAFEKAATETSARALLLGGGKLADVWERFRVL